MKKLVCTLIFLLICLVAGTLHAAGPRGGPGGQGPGDLTDDERTDLLFIREEEKLARDVYLEMYNVWDEEIFANISESEQRHMNAMLRMIELFEETDPVGDNGVGVFTDPAIQALYNDLVSMGQTSLIEALQVGVLIEEMDIESLLDAIGTTQKPPLDKSYGNLLAGSYNHLAAFIRHLDRLGFVYAGTAIDLEIFRDGSAGDRTGGRDPNCGEPRRKGANPNIAPRRTYND
jgi:hypothetical protein